MPRNKKTKRQSPLFPRRKLRDQDQADVGYGLQNNHILEEVSQDNMFESMRRER